MKVTQAYALITKNENEEIENFYEDIEIALRKNNCYYIFLTGNFNAKTDKQMDRTETAIGKFCTNI